jgi:hypothetical protein
MVRQAICDPKFEGYLAGLGQTGKLSIGLVIGQVRELAEDFLTIFKFLLVF